jgi:drug/metabolite transporter (DMT)-like permease
MNPAPQPRPSTAAFVLAFAAIYLIWGSTYLGMRVAVETLPPFTLAAARFLVAGTLLFVVVLSRGASLPTRAQWRSHAIAGTFLLLGGNGMVVWAEQFVPSGITALVIGLSPAFMVLTEWIWPGGHRPTVGTFIGLALGFIGVAWLAAPWEGSHTHVDPRGFAAIIAACISWSVGSIYSRRVKDSGPPFVAAAQQMLAGGIVLALTAVATGEIHSLDLASISTRSWVALGYLTLCGSLVGFSTFVWLMKHTTPAHVSTYAYVNPVVAVFLGWLILNEAISGRTLIAAAIIVAAVVIITIQKSRTPR